MQYYKHMSNMRHDIKIKRVISKYGVEGYGLYCLILESITENIATDSPIPDLQETCEDMAEFYNGNTAKINEIATYLLNQGLIEVDELTERITCKKIYKYLEQSQTRSQEIRNLISNYKNTQKKLLSETCNVLSNTVTDINDRIEKNRIEKNRIEKNRIEKNRIEKNRIELIKYGEFVKLQEKDYNILCNEYGKHEINNLIERMNNYIGSQKPKGYKSYIHALRNWIDRNNIKKIDTQGKCKYCGRNSLDNAKTKCMDYRCGKEQ